MTSKSPTTTNLDWLHNAHAGEMLRSEFMEPLDLDLSAMARLIDVAKR